MKAAIAENGKMVWKDVPEPVIGDTDVLVKVHATALNRADLLQNRERILHRRAGLPGPGWNCPVRSKIWEKPHGKKAVSASATAYARS